MATLNEGKHTGEYLVSESNGTRSRGTGIVLSGQDIVAGEVVGIETASGKYVAYDPANTIVGSGTAVGVSYDNVDATAGDVSGSVFTLRSTEVRKSDLTYNTVVQGEIDAVDAALKALEIIVR